jgi:hypothetical protein
MNDQITRLPRFAVKGAAAVVAVGAITASAGVTAQGSALA